MMLYYPRHCFGNFIFDIFMEIPACYINFLSSYALSPLPSKNLGNYNVFLKNSN